MKKLTTAGLILIMAGVISLILFFDTMAPVSIGMIVTGALMEAAVAMKTKKDRPVPCRLGFHRYDHTGYDEENRSMRVYQCRRCDKIKKAVLGGG
jgi:hypothetical protein